MRMNVQVTYIAYESLVPQMQKSANRPWAGWRSLWCHIIVISSLLRSARHGISCRTKRLCSHASRLIIIFRLYLIWNVSLCRSVCTSCKLSAYVLQDAPLVSHQRIFFSVYLMQVDRLCPSGCTSCESSAYLLQFVLHVNCKFMSFRLQLLLVVSLYLLSRVRGRYVSWETWYVIKNTVWPTE